MSSATRGSSPTPDRLRQVRQHSQRDPDGVLGCRSAYGHVSTSRHTLLPLKSLWRYHMHVSPRLPPSRGGPRALHPSHPPRPATSAARSRDPLGIAPPPAPRPAPSGASPRLPAPGGPPGSPP